MKIPRSAILEYRKWHKDWDSLCKRCGLCCYERSYSEMGDIIVDFSDPCEYLNEETHMCRVYDTRFRQCKECVKVNFFRALFSPFLPPTCAYVEMFRSEPYEK